MRYRMAVLLIALVWGVSACNLSSSGGAQNAPSLTAGSGSPVVTILSPQDGAEVVVSQQILVSANANDPVGITRVQLFANGQIAKTVSSETPGGDPNLNVLLDYTPTATGSLTLRVIAFRGATASDPAEITVTVRDTQAQITATTQAPPIIVPPIDPYDLTCRVLVNSPLNFRTGPGTNYDRISVLATGTVAPITGRTGDNQWWQIRVGVVSGWVNGGYVTLYGNCQNVSIPPIPPTPTPLITATFTSAPPTNTLTLTPQPPTLTPTPGLPDLVVTNVSLVGTPPLTLGAGDTPVSATFSVTITNTGASAATQFSSTISVSPPGVESPLGVVGSLGPGESVVLNVTLTFSAANTYTIQARADSDGQITETSEVNNVGFTTVIVNPAP
jgi:CARDB/Bacterial Ig domain/Bacterial SH3 domain